jgi:hypothetical protein
VADTLALEKLFDDVTARFALDGLSVPNLFGWRPPPEKLTLGNRIIWTPGDIDDGTFGEVTALGVQPGRNPRSLATVLETFTVQILAADTASPELERAQYKAVRLLYDAWYRACWLAAHTTFLVVDQRWLIEKKERRYGAGLRILCTVQAMVPDVAATDATQGLGVEADLTTIELSVSETDLNIQGA